MSDDDEIKSRNDFLAAPDVPTRPGTLPPAAKVALAIGHAIREVSIPVLALLALRWGLVGADVFSFALGGLVGGGYALRRGEGPDITLRR